MIVCSRSCPFSRGSAVELPTKAPARTCEGEEIIAKAGHLERAYRRTPTSRISLRNRGDRVSDTAVQGHGTIGGQLPPAGS